MPASDRVTLPRGFTPPRDDGSSPRSDTAEDEDLDELTAAAYREWGDLQIALEAFKANLGPDFEPLDQDLHPISMTPFGPAMRYRTYSIAGIWMNYLMGMVALHRAHPEMPPVAMMAAGMSAQHTMKYAMDMARIAHGLEENAAMIQEVSTLVSAAFIESAFCLFVAGVQVRPTAPCRGGLDSVRPTTSLAYQSTTGTGNYIYAYMIRTVPSRRPARMADPPPPPHLTTDGLGVSTADRRGLRDGVDPRRRRRPRPALHAPLGARPEQPAAQVGLVQPPAPRQAHRGDRGRLGPPRPGQGGDAALRPGPHRRRGGSRAAGSGDRGPGRAVVGVRRLGFGVWG